MRQADRTPDPTAPWVALVGPEIEENLSLRYLASSLQKHGIEGRILPFHHEDQLLGIVHDVSTARTPPVAVGLSLAFQWRAPDILALSLALREAGYAGHITAGGHFATFGCAELLRDFAELDSVCRQESEGVLPELVEAIRGNSPLGGVQGLSFRAADGAVVHNQAAPLPDLATLPWPDRSGEPAEVFGHRIAPLVGSRGCYANCTFCCIAAWHEQSLPGKRYRLRDVGELADEMAWLHVERGIELFVFHDDNFFLPQRGQNLARFHGLADALESRGVRRFATIVKARPTDVHPEVFRVLVDRLRCVRAYVGVETDSEQGLITLRRWAKPRHNHAAIETLRALPLFACFNVLLFDPDTTVESLEDNLAFMEATADFPFNFGRVELYAGTPLLARMQAEGRCRGDYLQWDYDLENPVIERIFRISSKAFHARNFSENALANAMMGTRFEVEACRHFHPDVYRPEWLREGLALSRRLGTHSVELLRRVIARVGQSPRSEDAASAAEFAAELAEADRPLRAGAQDLARAIHGAVGQGTPLTDLGDVTATPLQTGRLELS